MINPTGASGLLVAGIFFVVLVYHAAPMLVAVMNAAVPLVVAAGLVVMGLRLLWRFTDRY